MAGKGAGEVDGGAMLLTGYSIWGEEDRRVELDVRGRLPGGGAVAAGGGRSDSARERLKRVRGGATEVENEVERLWARGIKAGRRGMAGRRRR